MLEKSFEYIISEFNERFQNIDQLQLNFKNYTNTEKPTNLSENLANKEIELNETILALRSENAQVLEKIRVLETNLRQIMIPMNSSTCITIFVS